MLKSLKMYSVTVATGLQQGIESVKVKKTEPWSGDQKSCVYWRNIQIYILVLETKP